MKSSEILEQLLSMPKGEPFDWLGVRERIHEAKKVATSEEEHVKLLQLYKGLMDIMESRIADPADRLEIRKLRLQEFRMLLFYETLVGENISPARLDYVTQREVAAGRMSADDELRKLAAAGAILIDQLPNGLRSQSPASILGRSLAWLRGLRRTQHDTRGVLRSFKAKTTLN